MSISHNTLEQNLSIEDAFDRAMSLPSSPTVKTAEDSFDSFEEEHCVGKPRSSSEKARRERAAHWLLHTRGHQVLQRGQFLAT